MQKNSNDINLEEENINPSSAGNHLTDGPILKSIILLAIPIVIANLFGAIISLIVYKSGKWSEKKIIEGYSISLS